MSSIASALEDPSVGYILEDHGSSTGVVAFGGISGGLSIPPFEFFRQLGELPVTKVFVRDVNQMWYAAGVPGLGGDLIGVAHGIDRLSREHGFTPALFGVSAGGFAAMAVGLAIGAPRVHAFSPQISLKRGARLRMLDRRWPNQIRRLRKNRGALDDLREMLRANQATKITIHVSSRYRLDRAHAELVDGYPNLEIVRYPFGAHGLVRDLRDRGVLRRILMDAIDGD